MVDPFLRSRDACSLMWCRKIIGVCAFLAVCTAQPCLDAAAVKAQEEPQKTPGRKSKSSSSAERPARDTPQKPRNPVVPEDPLVREALGAVFAGEREQLGLTYYQAIQREQASGDDRPLRTSDAILYLYNNSLPDREQFLQHQEIAAVQTKSEELRTRILVSLLSDELYELNKVEGQNRFNKFTRIFNRASTSLSQLVMLQPRAAVQLVWDGIYSVRQAKPATDRERKMVYLATNFLRKYPAAPEAPEVKEFLARLREKLNADRATRGKATGEIALKHGKYVIAEYHLEVAAILNPGDAETSQLLQQARNRRIQAEEALITSLGISGAEQQLNDSDAAMLSRACRAVTTGDSADTAKLQSYSSGVLDSIRVGNAALTESRGQHDSALRDLNNLLQQTPNTPGGRAAYACLRNPDYNLDEQFEQALRELAAQRRKFYWTGNRTSEDTSYQVGSATIQQGAQAASNVSMLAGADVLVRTISEQFTTSLDVDPVVDAGARYIRKYPKSGRATAIAAELADLAKKSRDYTRSEEYLASTGQATEGQLQKLHDKQAAVLFETAKKETDLTSRRKLLQEVAQKYPNSPVVQKSVGKELARIAPNVAADTVVLVHKMLTKDPAIATQLGLAAQYVDGSKNNGELAEEGIAITPSAGAFDYKIFGEDNFRTAALPQGNLEQLMARARQLQRDYSTQIQGQEVVHKQRLPFAVDGGVGGAGVDLAPKLIPAKADPRDKERFN